MLKHVNNVRQIPLVDSHTFLFEGKGTIVQNALLLHDVDDDAVRLL